MTIQQSTYVWFDGELIPWERATIHVASHVVHYGSSVFEGIRAYTTRTGPAIFCLDAHVDRLYSSAKIYRIEIPYSKEALRQAIVDTVRANAHQACYIRPVVFRGFDGWHLIPHSCPVQVAIVTTEWDNLLGREAIEQGVDVGVSSWTRIAPNTLPAAAKIGGQYINSQLIAMEAARHGYGEGIALDVNGWVSEGSGENVFAVVAGDIVTPPLAASILQGITRRCAIRLARDLGYSVREELMPRELLYLADELFFTGTAAGITTLRSIDGMPVASGGSGPVTR